MRDAVNLFSLSLARGRRPYHDHRSPVEHHHPDVR